MAVLPEFFRVPNGRHDLEIRLKSPDPEITA
jgi:hypothetical protein